MSLISPLYRISWVSAAGSESTYESDPHDAIHVARSNDGVIRYQGEEYTADELEQEITKHTGKGC